MTTWDLFYFGWAVQLTQVTADMLRVLLVGGFKATPYKLVTETGTWHYY